MIVHDSGRRMGGERRSRTRTWAVEFDGPSHFLPSRAPTGAVAGVQVGRREGAVPEGQAGTLCTNTITRTQTVQKIDLMTSFLYEGFTYLANLNLACKELQKVLIKKAMCIRR